MKWSTTLFFILLSQQGFAQLSASSAVLGPAVSQPQPGLVENNPALAAKVLNISLGMHAQRHLSQGELQTQSFSAVFPNRILSFASHISHYGFPGFSTLTAKAQLAKDFQSFSAGIGVGMDRLAIEHYGQAMKLRLQAGIFMPLSNKVDAGLVLNDPQGLSRQDSLIYQPPATIAASVSWKVSPEVLFLGTVQKALEEPVGFHAGVEYALVPALKLRLGTSLPQNSLRAGMALRLNRFQFDLGYVYKSLPGSDAHIGISYEIAR